jgi:hypothetical protein
MRERDAAIEARAAESFAIDQAFEDVVTDDVDVPARQQFAENLEAVFLASRRGVAENAIGLDEFLAGQGLIIEVCKRRRGRRPRRLPDQAYRDFCLSLAW